MSKSGKFILLSFDIEEFDLPEEYGQTVSETTQFEISRAGFQMLLELLEDYRIRSTLFVTAKFALRYPDLIRTAARTHEIASHGYSHSTFVTADLHRSKQTLEQVTDAPVVGFRIARLQPIDEQAIVQSGYRYNSSLNPTYIPGRYNNFFKERTAHQVGALLNIPVSVTPLIRFPLFWLSFKLIPLPVIKLASHLTLNHDRYLALYFHPWEFADLSGFALPAYIKHRSGRPMLDRLREYLLWLQPQADFITYSDFAGLADRNRDAAHRARHKIVSP